MPARTRADKQPLRGIFNTKLAHKISGLAYGLFFVLTEISQNDCFDKPTASVLTLTNDICKKTKQFGPCFAWLTSAVKQERWECTGKLDLPSTKVFSFTHSTELKFLCCYLVELKMSVNMNITQTCIKLMKP